jgi:hypothetical protein
MGNSSIKITTYLEEEYYKTIKEQDDVSDLIREHKLRQLQRKRIKQIEQVGNNLQKNMCNKRVVHAI